MNLGWSVVLIAAALPGVALAQASGELRLAIQDPAGVAMQASGSVQGPATGRRFQTDSQGRVTLFMVSFFVGAAIYVQSYIQPLSAQVTV